MTRTQILLEAWQHEFLSSLARKSGLSLSGLIRRWVEEKAAPVRGAIQADPLVKIVGAVEDPAHDVSENVGGYLYGKRDPASG